MSIESQFEREEELIEQDYAAGNISSDERNRLLRDLHRDYREAARESAQDAYDREMERW